MEPSRTPPTYRRDLRVRRLLIVVFFAILLFGGAACFRKLEVRRTFSSLVDRIRHGPIEGSALTGGGSATPGVTNAPSGGGFKTVAAVGLIADDLEARLRRLEQGAGGGR